MESNKPAMSIKSDTNSEENILKFTLQFNVIILILNYMN